MIPVKEHHGLYRDETTNAIVNCSTDEYEQYILEKNQRLTQIKEIDSIKEDINEIKIALKMIIEKINN